MKNPPNATSEKSTNSVRDELSAVHVAETEICGNQSATFRDGGVAYAAWWHDVGGGAVVLLPYGMSQWAS
jgi:hypothetical protein